jgi:hypothetical protein
MLILGLVFAASLNLGLAQASNYAVTISQNTVWTKANSPYNLPGNILVSKGATLTIEAGVIVNFYRYIIQVNGTLKVEGTADSNVVFTNTNKEIQDARAQLADINFGDDSTSDVIEYTVFPTMALSYFHCQNTIVLNNNIFKEGATPISSGFIGVTPIIRGPGTANITNNVFTDGLQDYCSSTITNNTFVGGGIDVEYGSFLISNNTFLGDSSIGSGFGITIGYGAKAVVSDNYLSGYSEACIDVGGFALIQRNSIQNSFPKGDYPFFGIEIRGFSPLVENNTIANCNLGIGVYSHGSDYSAIQAKPTIKNNNVVNSKEYNLFLGYPSRGGYSTNDFVIGNIDASDNWWGTTDQRAISQTIRDSKVQSNLGTANFLPFLSTPNLQATPNPDEPTPTVSQIPTASYLEASTNSGGKVALIVNGNMTLPVNPTANVTANQMSGVANVTLTVDCDKGTSSFINVTVPKTSIPQGVPTIYFDNALAQNQGHTQDADNYYVWCTNYFNNGYYGDLTIVFSGAAFPTDMAIAAGLVVIVVGILVVLIYRAKKRKPQSNLF